MEREMGIQRPEQIESILRCNLPRFYEASFARIPVRGIKNARHMQIGCILLAIFVVLSWCLRRVPDSQPYRLHFRVGNCDVS